jgi:ubiquinone/menaquinone biosynthesis C-methylase UbiE
MASYTQHYLLGQQFQDPRLQATFAAETKFLLDKILQANAHAILDVGCGNGRTLRNLAPLIQQRRNNGSAWLYGIDTDSELLELAIQPFELGRNWLGVVNMCRWGDARKMDFETDAFDLSYSSYNTLGGLDTITDRNAIVNEMTRVTRPNGLVTGITWKRDDATTDFLRTYYPAIGFEIVYIDSGKTLVKSTLTGDEQEFVRIHPNGLSWTFERAGLKDLKVEEVGPLWVAITGVKGGEQ